MTALPPLFAGAVNVTLTSPEPFETAVAATPDGASGSEYGEIADDADDSEDHPAAFWAAAVQV